MEQKASQSLPALQAPVLEPEFAIAPEVMVLRFSSQCMHRWPCQLPELGVPETRHGLRARSRHPMPNRCSRHPL